MWSKHSINKIWRFMCLMDYCVSGTLKQQNMVLLVSNNTNNPIQISGRCWSFVSQSLSFVLQHLLALSKEPCSFLCQGPDNKQLHFSNLFSLRQYSTWLSDKIQVMYIHVSCFLPRGSISDTVSCSSRCSAARLFSAVYWSENFLCNGC